MLSESFKEENKIMFNLWMAIQIEPKKVHNFIEAN